MSIKAPTLNHKRTLSSLNKPSPNTQPSPAASSPERAQKRARFEAVPNTSISGNTSGVSPTNFSGNIKVEGNFGGNNATSEGGDKDQKMSSGAAWVLERIELLERQYKDAIVSATLIMQYKAYSRKIGLRSDRVPVHLQQRMDHAWATYECTRRHIEHYLLQCARQASTPSQPIPTALPPPPSLPPPQITTSPKTMGASPVPLSTASMMAFDPTDVAKLASLMKPSDGGIQIPEGGLVFSSNNGNGNGNGDGTIDLSNMDMAELAAIVNGNGMPFNGNQADALNGLATTNNNQANTEQVLAALNSSTIDTQNQAAGNGTGTSEADLQAMLAGLGQPTGDNQYDGFNFELPAELGDMDLSSLSELAGLFDSNNASQVGTASVTPLPNTGLELGSAVQQTVDPPTLKDANQPPNTVPPPMETKPEQFEPEQNPPQPQHQQPVTIGQPQQNQSAPQPSEPQQQQQQQQQQQPPQQNAQPIPPTDTSQIDNLFPQLAQDSNNTDEFNNLGALSTNNNTTTANSQQGEYDFGTGIDMNDFDFGGEELTNLDGIDFDAMFAEFQ